MIFDKLSNINTYVDLHPRFSKVFEWLKNTNLNELLIGEKYFIENENIFATLSEYETFPSYKKTFEGHYKYIDIQLILSGAEIMEVSMIKNDMEKDIEYSEEKERYKVKTEADAKVLVKENEFTIFFPQDLHKPCINYSYKSEKVKKLVIKVLL